MPARAAVDATTPASRRRIGQDERAATPPMLGRDAFDHLPRAITRQYLAGVLRSIDWSPFSSRCRLLHKLAIGDLKIPFAVYRRPCRLTKIILRLSPADFSLPLAFRIGHRRHTKKRHFKRVCFLMMSPFLLPMPSSEKWPFQQRAFKKIPHFCFSTTATMTLLRRYHFDDV